MGLLEVKSAMFHEMCFHLFNVIDPLPIELVRGYEKIVFFVVFKGFL